MKQNKVRIIGGRWRGRQINFPDVKNLRPTGDRIRETLFNWLQKKIVDSHCLDLFSGSGVLGFESLSRGAAHVVFIDKNRDAVESLQKNAKQLSAENFEIIQEAFPSENLNKIISQKKFDIVFVDPPFENNLIPATLIWLASANILAENAVIYVECVRAEKLSIPENFSIIKSKQAGNVSYFLLLYAMQRCLQNPILKFTHQD